MTTDQEVGTLVKGLGGLPEPAPKEVERLLAAKLPLKDENNFYTIFGTDLTTPPFSQAELRLNKADPTQGLLVLTAAPASSPQEAELNLAQYGPVASVKVNPRIPPEGTVSKVIMLGDVKVSFQLTAKSKQLRLVSLEWKPD